MIFGEYKGYHYAFGKFKFNQEFDAHGLGFIPVRLDCVKGPRHILSSILTAIDAINSGKAIARDLKFEFLLRLAGTRQIDKARDCLGSEGWVYLVWIGKDVPPRPGLPEEGIKFENPSRLELDAIESRLLFD